VERSNRCWMLVTRCAWVAKLKGEVLRLIGTRDIEQARRPRWPWVFCLFSIVGISGAAWTVQADQRWWILGLGALPLVAALVSVTLFGLRAIYPAETLSKALTSRLRRRFAGTSPQTSVAPVGAGEYWNCTAERGPSRCVVSCFGGPVFLATLHRGGEPQAYARTADASAVRDVVSDWLQGAAVPDLYPDHACVDWCKRALANVRDDIFAHNPDLEASLPNDLYQRIADIHHLEFKLNDRTCDLSVGRSDGRLHARFTWDECDQFEYAPEDHADLADVLKRWICDVAKPSARTRTTDRMEDATVSHCAVSAPGTATKPLVSRHSICWTA
jgi:hypothetical protein